MNEYYKNYSLENIVYFCEVDNRFKFEQWKDVPGYEGLYQASDLGRIKSLNYKKTKKEGIIKSCFDLNKYLIVGLYKNKKPKTRTVHQIVGECFLNHKPNKYHLVVEHINHIKHDCSLKNITIITQRKNANQKHLPSTSKFTGVCWHKRDNKWVSTIYLKGKIIHLGYFDDEEEASLYYENALIAIENGTEIIVKKHKYSSEYKGVCYDKSRNKWNASISINKKHKYIGRFKTEIEAKDAIEIFKKNNLIK